MRPPFGDEFPPPLAATAQGLDLEVQFVEVDRQRLRRRRRGGREAESLLRARSRVVDDLPCLIRDAGAETDAAERRPRLDDRLELPAVVPLLLEPLIEEDFQLLEADRDVVPRG